MSIWFVSSSWVTKNIYTKYILVSKLSKLKKWNHMSYPPSTEQSYFFETLRKYSSSDKCFSWKNAIFKVSFGECHGKTSVRRMIQKLGGERKQNSFLFVVVAMKLMEPEWIPDTFGQNSRISVNFWSDFGWDNHNFRKNHTKKSTKLAQLQLWTVVILRTLFWFRKATTITSITWASPSRLKTLFLHLTYPVQNAVKKNKKSAQTHHQKI